MTNDPSENSEGNWPQQKRLEAADDAVRFVDSDNRTLFNNRATCWVFTWNNPPPDGKQKLIELFNLIGADFFIMELEEGEIEKTLHWQGYFRLSKRQYRRSINTSAQRKGISWWLDRAKGTEAENIQYCSKTGREVTQEGEIAEATRKEVLFP